MNLAFEGRWAEHAPASVGHAATLADITWNAAASRYDFSGTNFWDDGRVHCTFQTEAGWLDEAGGRFYYIFSGKMADSNDAYTGFGTLNLSPDPAGALVPVSGHFTTTSESPQAFTHTMVPANHLPNPHTHPQEAGKAVLALLGLATSPQSPA